MNPRYAEVALRAGHRCEYCHAPEAVFNLPFEVEHIVPTCRGGVDAGANWALACRSCNLRKAAHVSGIDPESQTEVRLFRPREDRWDQHFRLDGASGKIQGLTPVGRASVIRLEINSEAQAAARRQWMRLGLFP
jgi:hypothetical protein